MDLGIRGRVALVTGATGGMGAAIAAALHREGARVAVSARDADRLDRLRQEVGTGEAGEVLPVVADLHDLGALDAAVATVTATLGPVDILVNNTGGPPPGPVRGVPSDGWRRHFDGMVTSVLHLTDSVLPGMVARKWGRVVTSTSSGVIAPIPNLGISNTLRSALVGWSKTLAAEVGRDGVTSNVVLPGRIATSRVAALDEARARREGRAVEDVAAQSMGTIPAGRYGRPEEYGDVVAFLASERASYINGSVIRVDGGMIQSV
jgi:3-oxoacyl-[acyl-carrier protein] reductase